MSLISKLERRFGAWAVPYLTVYLIVLQVIGVALLVGKHNEPTQMVLQGGHVLYLGEWWRLITFMMVPKTLSPIWLVFAFYIFYLMGSALEEHWGAFRYNLYILSGYLLTVAAAFMAPTAVITNFYFLGGVFLAFATLYPNFELSLFFILPIKVKWLGWLTAITYAFAFFSGDLGIRLCVVAVLIVYLLFFGGDILHSIQARRRRTAFVEQQGRVEQATRHCCVVCKITEQDDELMHFRYCSVCGQCFCEKHIADHRHDESD